MRLCTFGAPSGDSVNVLSNCEDEDNCEDGDKGYQSCNLSEAEQRHHQTAVSALTVVNITKVGHAIYIYIYIYIYIAFYVAWQLPALQRNEALSKLKI